MRQAKRICEYDGYPVLVQSDGAKCRRRFEGTGCNGRESRREDIVILIFWLMRPGPERREPILARSLAFDIQL
jgi:hypothetical protein